MSKIQRFMPGTHPVRNYFGQLRLYSWIDLMILLLAFGAGLLQLLSVSLLWFGFLVFLESVHKDAGRRRWHWSLWLVPWLLGVALIQQPALLIFFTTSVLYALKKRKPFGLVSPLLSGVHKASLVYLVVSEVSGPLVMVALLMGIRNLVGDIRDAGKDAAEGVLTLPVYGGYRNNTPYVYPASLTLTTAVWVYIGGFSLMLLPLLWLMQYWTYPLTIR